MKRVQIILLLSVLFFVPTISAALASSSFYSDQNNYYTVKSGSVDFKEIDHMRNVLADKFPDANVATKGYLSKKDIILTAPTDKFKDENKKEALYTVIWGNYSSLDEAIKNFDVIKQELTKKQYKLHWIEYTKSILCEIPTRYRVNAGGGNSEAVNQMLELLKPQFPDAIIKTGLIKESNVLKVIDRQKLESFDNEQEYYFIEAGEFGTYQRAEEAYIKILKIKNITDQQRALLRIEKPEFQASDEVTTKYFTHFGIGSKEEMEKLRKIVAPSFPAATIIEKQIEKGRIIKIEDEDYRNIEGEESVYTLKINETKSFEVADADYGKSLQLKKDDMQIPWIEAGEFCECDMPREFLVRIGTELNQETLSALQADMAREYPNASIESAFFLKPRIVWTSMQKSELDGIDKAQKYHTIRLGDFLPGDGEIISKRLIQQLAEKKGQGDQYRNKVFVKQKDDYKAYDKDDLGKNIRKDILDRGICPSYAFRKALGEGHDFCRVLLATGHSANDADCSCIRNQFFAGAADRFAECGADPAGPRLCPDCPINIGSGDTPVNPPASAHTP